ncbi:MAG: 50S ribosomal protein L18 [Gammaproteobacteria bacterium RIFCSPHIGHO2_12_FULL_42_10]|nr:MAG: 50S ribosomal protein L18 [Gammaproteobacteria bacterium RIFCSPHIGHO2_12_FULL_42_10]
MNKKSSRLKRAKRTRCRIKTIDAVRLSVHKTSQHIYAQIITSDGAKTIVAASTLEKEFKAKATSNVDAAREIGKLIAERAIQSNIKAIAFDRSGYKYHGRIKALADAAREGGLEF